MAGTIVDLDVVDSHEQASKGEFVPCVCKYVHNEAHVLMSLTYFIIYGEKRTRQLAC